MVAVEQEITATDIQPRVFDLPPDFEYGEVFSYWVGPFKIDKTAIEGHKSLDEYTDSNDHFDRAFYVYDDNTPITVYERYGFDLVPADMGVHTAVTSGPFIHIKETVHGHHELIAFQGSRHPVEQVERIEDEHGNKMTIVSFRKFRQSEDHRIEKRIDGPWIVRTITIPGEHSLSDLSDGPQRIYQHRIIGTDEQALTQVQTRRLRYVPTSARVEWGARHVGARVWVEGAHSLTAFDSEPISLTHQPVERKPNVALVKTGWHRQPHTMIEYRSIRPAHVIYVRESEDMANS